MINQRRYYISKFTIVFASAILLLGIAPVGAAVLVEAESGTLGSNFTNGFDGATQFISISTDTVNSGNPGNTNRIATYTVTFPAAGTYKLYGRVRVGSGSASDDSFFYANGFGVKSVTNDGDWILNNNLYTGGFTSSNDVVSGSGSAGISVWKWVSFSDYTGGAGETPISFTVPSGSLTQTFQIGGRENGFDMDKFVFALTGTTLTVSNLDAVANGSGSSDPIAYLRFDETSGTMAADSSGNGWNGTLINGPTWTSGRINNAVSLDGNDDYVALSSGVVSNLTDFTISTWVKLNGVSASSRIFDFGTATNNYMFLTPNTNGVVRFAIQTPAVSEQTISGTSALPSGVWTHVLVTLSGSTGTLYVNGSPVGTNASMTLTPSSLGNTTNNFIGRSQFNSDPYLNGNVDEFMIFNRALNSAEILSLANPPSAPTNIAAIGGNSQVALNWNVVSGADSYTVKRAASGIGPFTEAATGLLTTNFTDYPLTNGTAYFYVVTTRKSVAESSNSIVVSATPQPPPLPPPAPTYLNAAPGDGQINLSWTASTLATGYIISRSTSASGFVPISEIASENSFTDIGLTNGTTYYYIVTATNADGASPNSVPAEATPAQTFSEWTANEFPGQSDPNIVNPEADPDHDGKIDIIEYFAGTNPNSPDSSPLMSLNADDPSSLVLTLRKSKNLTGLSYSIEKSSDLLNWVGTGLLAKIISAQDGYDIMQVTIPRGNGDKLFLRLVVTTSPQDDSANSVRERISIDDDWRFMKYASQNVADGLVYDTNRTDIVNGTVPLKPYILPTGNEFAKNPTNQYVRPAGNPGSTFAFVQSDFDDSSWTNLNLPHDWAIAGAFGSYNNAAMGLLPSPGVGWYRKKLDISASDADKSIFLDVDGAMSYAMVWLNGNLVGGWPYGYASWRLDLTHYIVPGGTNQLAIRVDNPTDSSRWYPGGGIYRNVWLTKTQPIHVAHWGTFLTTTNVSVTNATINLKVTIDNHSTSNANLVAMTQIIALDSDADKIGDSVADFAPVSVSIAAGTNAQINSSVSLANPRLWGPPPTQVPNRYVAMTTLWQNGELIDSYETRFGIRSVTFDPNSGIYVNGEHIYIQGVDDHHDLGALGAAFNYRAAQRQLEELRDMGCNAIRMSHNPPAPELLDLCDQMGFLVLDEIFDCWVSQKNPNDFHLIFPEWHEQDLRAMIRRDRNHPSVIIWSFGNEVGEQYSGTAGAAIGQELHDIVHDEDPTRPATTAMNAAQPTDPLPVVPDLIGLNYRGEGIRDGAAYAGLSGITTPPQYQAFHTQFPNKVILSTENAAALSTRGTFLFPVTSYNSAPYSVSGGSDSVNHYVSAYGLYTDNFGASPDKVFAAQDQNPFVAGGFTWSGWDYLGEPSPYYGPARSSYYGIIDLAGFPKDRFYLYQSRWRPDLPMAHILPHWTWSSRVGQVTPVHVFTSGDEAELFLNGISQGRKMKASGEYRLRWDNVVYQPGELKVVAYKNGKVWAMSTNNTAGNAAALQAAADRNQITADGLDLSFVIVRVTDASGQTCPTAMNSINFSIAGPGQIVATDNGDPTSMVSFASTTRTAFNGYCLVIVRGIAGQSGDIQLTAQSASLQNATVTIHSVGSP